MLLKILKPWMNHLNIKKTENPWTSLNSLTISYIIIYTIMHYHTSSYIIISIQYIHIYTNLCWLRCFAKGRLFEFSYWRPCLPTCMRNFNARRTMEMDCRTELSRCSSHFKPDSWHRKVGFLYKVGHHTFMPWACDFCTHISENAYFCMFLSSF